MKGIILSGGHGTRLYPLTKVTSKQLLPVYNQPMIYYPLQTLIRGGIKEILIIVGPDHAGDYLKYLGSGKELGIKLAYEVQEKPTGLPEAFVIGKTFIGTDDVTLILGDNIFEDDFSKIIRGFKKGAHILAKKVKDPERFAVVKFNSKKEAVQIVEKPKEFVSNYAIPGFYIYDNRVAAVASRLTPSARNETEIVDLHNWYLARKELKVSTISGEWIDAGTFESLFRANLLIHQKSKLQNKK